MIARGEAPGTVHAPQTFQALSGRNNFSDREIPEPRETFSLSSPNEESAGVRSQKITHA